jgi:Na+/proline symporter
LVVAAILAAAMSNLSAALNALASTTIMDFYRPLRRAATGDRAPDERSQLRLARGATIAWGLVLLAIATVARHWGPVLEAGLTIASIAYGGLLGVFLLGLLPRRIPENAAIIGMVAGVAVVVFVRLDTHIAWTWYVAIGTIMTFITALAASVFLKEPAREPR